ncbi:hypothetical protein PR002_g20675 [Phytophthora rubi]|uniref:Tc1-like transposase DDE domain-containing protein n=1 Tax=Phytophthora rubi TaxID=129364 RepID=A0A6A3JHV7_9STRA|nr:hypothetical protein PR002_g20675 [Phytophthora rubi]
MNQAHGAVLQGDFVPGSVEYWNSTLKPKGEDDYHGNFDTAQFERWFEKLCTTLEDYGRCHIHMDGASYHKNIVNRQPTGNWRKAEIQAWLTANGHSYEKTDFL